MAEVLNSKEEVTLSVLREQISQCRSDITSFNLQFLASSAVNTIMSAFAVVLSENTAIGSLLYILPTMALIHMYNLLKYTKEMWQLSAYKLVLEHMVNQYLDEDVMLWELTFQGYRGANKFAFLNAFGQLFFIIPIGIFIFSGFFRMNHNWLWVILFICLSIEAVFLIFMAVDLAKTKKESLAELGYEIIDGELHTIDHA